VKESLMPIEFITKLTVLFAVALTTGTAQTATAQNGFSNSAPRQDMATLSTNANQLRQSQRLVAPPQVRQASQPARAASQTGLSEFYDRQDQGLGRTSYQAPYPRVATTRGVEPRQPRRQAPAYSPPKVRIKDITSIDGHRSNHVQGLGLVTGLNGTGGKLQLTQEMSNNLYRRQGIVTELESTGSNSAVMVNIEIEPFAREGQTVMATVSVTDGAKSLFGGTLQSTPLMVGADKKVYAIARGPLILGGYSAEGAGGSVTKNHVTTAKVAATIESTIYDGPAFPDNSYRLLLKNKDYATAYRIATEINRIWPGYARAADQGSVEVAFPRQYQKSKMDFVVLVNGLTVTPDIPARVVINQRSGTIVAGQNVRISMSLISRDNLIITTTEAPEVSQALPFAPGGETQQVPRTQISVTETGGGYNLLGQQTTVGELANALNTLGVSPQDLISVFNEIDQSGALQAKLIIE
jgi:flagellar P-ring protein precursor FlgI